MIKKNKFVESFANALFEIAKENNKINYYLKIINFLIDLFKKYPLYLKILSNTYISKIERKNILKESFENKIDIFILNSFYLLIDKECFLYVRLIFKEVRKLINKINHIQYGNIYSVIPLKKKEILKIQNKLIYKYKYKIELINKIDPTLIGGIKIKIKHIIIDDSIYSKLKNMKKNILIDNNNFYKK